MDKLTIWFRPTGWRPKGFEEKYPVEKITNHYNFQKFNPPYSKALLLWSIIQFFVFFFFFIYALSAIPKFGMTGLISFSLFVLVQVNSATELMNRNKQSPIFSIISTTVCIGLFVWNPSWMGLSDVSPVLPIAFSAFYILQTLMAFGLSRTMSDSYKGEDVIAEPLS